MNHFAKDDQMNIFRLPVGWQYLVNNKLGGALDTGNLAKYDELVQGCIKTGAVCVVDVSASSNGIYPTGVGTDSSDCP
jgi:endoglucanase